MRCGSKTALPLCAISRVLDRCIYGTPRCRIHLSAPFHTYLSIPNLSDLTLPPSLASKLLLHPNSSRSITSEGLVIMRSSATAGLTPQQLLDRRRAQNKLAQRRFREKARMVRSTGASSSASYLAAASSLPTFPPHLDLSRSANYAHDDTPRVRSASSDSSCTSLSSSTSTTFSSSVSSPTSSITELETPGVANIKEQRTDEATVLGEIHASNIFLPTQTKPDSYAAGASIFVQPPPPPPSSSFVPANFAILGAPLMQPAPLLPPPSEPLTYSSLASSSSSERSIGLKMIGLHTDPFLMSQPLPSPSLLLGTGQHLNVQLVSLPTLQDAQPFPPTTTSSSFENLLAITPRLAGSNVSEDASPNESCHSPSSGSSSSPTKLDASSLACIGETGASWHLDRAISRFAQSSASAPRPVQPLSIASRPFARVIPSIALHFNIDPAPLPALLSRLELHAPLSSDSETNKGLVFDPTINWDTLPPSMLPCTEQLLYPHRAFLDACLPWPSVRSRLLKHTLPHPVAEEEFALDLLLSVLSTDEALSSFTVYGDDVLDAEAWEVSQRLVSKWWGLFDDSIIRRSNWWRRQRGEAQLVLPTADDTANESERQGMGTGSLDEAHRIAALLFA